MKIVQVYQEVSQKLGVKYLQLNGTPKNFKWNTVPIGEMDAEAYLLVSSMPKYSPIGEFTSSTTKFFDAYSNIFSHVTFKGSPEQEQAIKDASNQVITKQNAITEATSNMNSAYLAAKQNGGIIFDAKYPDITSWFNDSPEATVYNDAKKAATVAYKKALEFKLQLEEAFMPTSLQDAMEARRRPTSDPASRTAPRGWIKVKDGSGILRWEPEYIVGTTGKDWRAELTNGSQGAFTIRLDASKHTSSMDKTWAGSKAGYSCFFWGVSGKGGWQKFDLTTSDSSLTCEISVESSTLVDVQRGAWYNGGFINELAKAKQGASGQGFTIVNPWVANGDSNSLFGPNGILNAGITRLLVAYKPSFKVTMNESTYKRHHEKFEGSGGFRIGPFHFGGSGGHESEYKRFASKGNTFEGSSKSESPVIFGVEISFPGDITP
jgi:hypothetical protein